MLLHVAFLFVHVCACMHTHMCVCVYVYKRDPQRVREKERIDKQYHLI